MILKIFIILVEKGKKLKIIRNKAEVRACLKKMHDNVVREEVYRLK